MKIKKPDDFFLEKARSLSETEAEYLQSRMKGRLHRRMEDRKLNTLEAMAIQLEIEDFELNEWRKRIAEIRAQQK